MMNEVFRMKKICVFLLMLSFISAVTSGCSLKPSKKPNMIQSKRRFAEYVGESKPVKDKNVIDLSEGPKLDYSGNLGPKNLNFEIKIIDPY